MNPALFALAPMPPLTTTPPAWELEAHQICYTSGLLVHLLPRPGSGLVVLTSVIGGGTAAEDPQTRGAAHLVEHLWFRSSPAGGPSPWELQAGLDMQGSTHGDVTVYTTVGAAPDLPALLRLEGQRLLDPLQGIDEDAVRAEAAVVASELAWRDEEAAREAMRLLDRYLWPEDHAYAGALPVEATLESLRAYVGTSYRPDRAALRVEGDFSPEALLPLLRETFPAGLLDGPGSSCERHPSRQPPPEPMATGLVHLDVPVWRPRLYVAWSLPAGYGAEDTMREFAARVLERSLWWPMLHAGGFRREHDYAELDVGCTYQPGMLGSRLVCQVELPDRASVDKAYELVRRHVDRSWANDPDLLAPELQTWSWAYRYAAGLLESLDEDILVHRGLSSWVGQPDPAAPVMDAVMGLDQLDVAAFLDRWLGPERMVALALHPNETLRVQQRSAELSAELQAPELPPWKIPAAGASPAQVRQLDNGLQVWMLPEPHPLLARTAVISRGGWATSPAAGAHELLDHIERRALPVPSQTLRARVGLDLWMESEPAADLVETTGPAANLDLALWVQQGLARPGPLDFSLRQQRLDPAVESIFGALREIPAAQGESLRRGSLLPQDRAGMAWWDRIRAARSLQEKQVLSWQRSVRHPGASVLLVQGELELAQTMAAAELYLGSWKGRGAPAAPLLPALPPPPAPQVYVLDAPTVLSDVVVTCRLPGRTDANAALHAVLLEVLRRGTFRSLREGGGIYAHFVSSEFFDPRVGLLTLQARVWPWEAQGTLETLLGLVRLAADDIPDEVLAWARLDAGGAHARSLAWGSSRYRTSLLAATEGRSPAGLAAMGSQIAQSHGKAVSALLSDCARHEVATVTGPDPGGLPEAQRLDWVARGEDLVHSLR